MECGAKKGNLEAAKFPGWVQWKGRLHPYAGLFSILGILIVLGTFIVKDVLRDQAKDLLGSLEAAEATAMLKQSINLIGEKLAFIERNLESFRSQSIQEADAERRFEFVAATAALTLHNTRNQLASIALLSAKLPSDFLPRKTYRSWQKDFEAKLKEIEARYDALSRAYAELAMPSYLVGMFVPPRLVLQMPHITEQERANKISSLYLQMAAAYKSLKDLESEVMKERDRLTADFEKETAHASHWFRTCTYISYVLYPAGILISILGGIAGARVPGTGE